MWILIGCIIAIIIVSLVVSAINTPKIKNKKLVNDELEKEFLQQNNIIVTKEYCYSDSYYENNVSLSDCVRVRFIIDQKHQKIVILSMKDDNWEIIDFSDLIGDEIVVDNEVVGGISRAVVGGVLAGGAGAIVGAMTAKKHIMSYKVVIYKRDLDNPKTEMQLISKKTTSKDKYYLNAVEFSNNISATIKAIINMNSYEEM